MDWGKRLKRRARALGLSDVQVARALGLSQGRYSSYVNQTREPDLELLVRICAYLGTTPNDVLGVEQRPSDREALLARILDHLKALDDDALAIVASGLALIAREPAVPSPEPKAKKVGRNKNPG